MQTPIDWVTVMQAVSMRRSRSSQWWDTDAGRGILDRRANLVLHSPNSNVVLFGLSDILMVAVVPVRDDVLSSDELSCV